MAVTNREWELVYRAARECSQWACCNKAPFSETTMGSGILDQMSARTLFRSLARNRGEWLAQGIFVHLMRSEEACRNLVIERAGLHVDSSEEPDVIEEQADERTGWRVDVLVTWSVTPLRVELKLAASLTPRQGTALAEGRVGLFVVPASRQDDQDIGSTPRVTWAELARVSKDQAVKALLEQVDSETDWLLDSVHASALNDDFVSYSTGSADARWSTLYRFLSTVDSGLRQRLSGYQPSSSWSSSRGRWYGYYFVVSPSPAASKSHWLGVHRTDGDESPALVLFESNTVVGKWPLEGEICASKLVSDIIARCTPSS